jgi:hypothetical protein
MGLLGEELSGISKYRTWASMEARPLPIYRSRTLLLACTGNNVAHGTY